MEFMNFSFYRTRKKLLVLAFIFLTLYCYSRFHFSFPHKADNDDTQVSKERIHLANDTDKIAIGLVVCGGEGLPNRTKCGIQTREAAVTMIKSLLISAKVSGSKSVELHIAIDGPIVQAILQKHIKEFQDAIKDFVEMAVYFYNALESVPRGYQHDFVDGDFRCGYVRFFFPDMLPKELQQVLYLDTDTLITGNITETWQHFKDQVVNHPTQLAVMVQNTEENQHFNSFFTEHFSTIPHVPPKGVNDGVMFMNLKAMREFNWAEKLMETFVQYRKLITEDQKLVNILFNKSLDRLTQFSCQYNFMHVHCDKGLFCKNLTGDPGGIRIVHGAGNQFLKKNHCLEKLFQAYKLFPVNQLQNVDTKFFLKLRNQLHDKNIYRYLNRHMIPCYRIMGEYLFKHLLVPSNSSRISRLRNVGFNFKMPHT